MRRDFSDDAMDRRGLLLPPLTGGLLVMLTAPLALLLLLDPVLVWIGALQVARRDRLALGEVPDSDVLPVDVLPVLPISLPLVLLPVVLLPVLPPPLLLTPPPAITKGHERGLTTEAEALLWWCGC
jgi:hypothetical protein